MLDLEGRTILVTGASKGIGAAVARALGAQGASVIAHYRGDAAGARDATAGISAERRLLVRANLDQPGAAAKLWADALSWHGRINVLVNNAAVMPFKGGIYDADEAWEDAWARSWQVNVKAPADLMREAVKHFRAQSGGILITVSSWVAQRGSTNPATIAYAASKAATMAATKTVARAYAKDNVLWLVFSFGPEQAEIFEKLP